MAEFGIGRAICSLAIAPWLCAGAALAQPYAYTPPQQPAYGYAPQQGYADNAPDHGCCRVPAGTEVAVQLVKAIGTEDAQAGDTFELRLAAPLIVDGQVVLPVGTQGVGHVVQSSGPGLGGKGAKLIVAADYLTVPGGAVKLAGMHLTGTGRDHSQAADLLGLGGIVFMPLGFAGIVLLGGNIQIPAGTAAAAKIAEPVSLPPVAAATPADYARVQAVFGQRQTTRGWLDIPPPPPGLGQVVFFRPKSIGDFQWFKVRENGQALGKLTGGAYFIALLTPGPHSFTAKSEPELKDHLTLQVDAGETYYVEGTMTHGLVLGAAELTPSDKARFDALSGRLKPAPEVRTASR